jgi:hypothetical protein
MTSLNNEQLYNVSGSLFRVVIQLIAVQRRYTADRRSETLYSWSLFRDIIHLIAVQSRYTFDRSSEMLYQLYNVSEQRPAL